MTTTLDTRPVSASQLSLLGKLFAERNLSATDFQKPATLTEASALISAVMALPKPVQDVPTEAGVYELKNVFYVARPSRNGNWLLAFKVEEKGKTSYHGGIRSLKGARKLSADEVSALGVKEQFTYCVCCNRRLTVPESVTRKIGPICLAKFF